MAELKITQKIKNGHYHIVYIRDDDTGVTSIAKNHSHTISRNIAQEPSLDPATQQVIMTPVDMGWQISPAPDGHTHEITDYVPKVEDGEEDDKKIINDFLVDYSEARKTEENSRKMGEESEGMYCHEQWDKEDVDSLPEGRSALTINRLEEKIDNLSGYQRQNRTEIKFLPMEDGDGAIADILNVVVKNILEQCYYQREKTKVFEDMAIVGRGLFNHYVDYEKDIRGQVIVEKFKWDEAYFGPHRKEDASDADYCIKERWFSESKLKEMYPEEMSDVNIETKPQPGYIGVSEDWDKRIAQWNLVNVNAKKYCLLERTRKAYKRVYVLVNSEDEFVFNADGWAEADINATKTIPGFNKIPRTSYRMRVTKYIVNKVLEDEYTDDLEFPLIPAYAKFRKDLFWGKIESVKDLQRLIDKSYSQFIDIIAKVSNYGYFYDDDTFATPKDEAQWKSTASSPGFTAKVNDVNKRPVKEEGVKFPSEIVNAINMFNMDLRQMMNINLELTQGGNQSEQTGVALRQKITQQLLGNDFIFDNLSFAEKVLGRVLVTQYIQKIYTPRRIMRILANENSRSPVTIQGKPLEQYNPADIERLLSESDLTKYDVIVGESSASPSVMMGAYLMTLEVARSGVPIPPDIFVELSPMPKDLKDKIRESIAAAQQAEQQAEQMKYGTEIEKARIAQQGKMMDKNPMQRVGGVPGMGGGIQQ